MLAKENALTGNTVMRRLAGGIGLLVALFCAVGLPLEISQQRAARSWEPRKVRITKSEVVTGIAPDGHGDRWFELELRDLQDHTVTSRVRVRFGFYPSYAPSDQAKYPIGKETIAYSNPQDKDEKYVLEQNNSHVLEVIWIASLIWIAVNVYIFVRYGSF